MSFAYNPPPRRPRIAEFGDDEVDGIFDTLTSAVDSMSKAVAAGSKVATTVGAAAGPILSAARQAAGASRPQAPAVSMRAAMPVRATSEPFRTQTFARMPALPVSQERPASEPATSHAVPIAIGAALVVAAGGGALWLFTRKDGRRASHR